MGGDEIEIWLKMRLGYGWQWDLYMVADEIVIWLAMRLRPLDKIYHFLVQTYHLW